MSGRLPHEPSPLFDGLLRRVALDELAIQVERRLTTWAGVRSLVGAIANERVVAVANVTDRLQYRLLETSPSTSAAPQHGAGMPAPGPLGPCRRSPSV